MKMENQKQQLAVEWLISRLKIMEAIDVRDVEQAKAMEEDGRHASYLYGHKVGYIKSEQIQKEQRGYGEEEVKSAYFQGEKDSYVKGGQTKEIENDFIQSTQQKKLSALIIIDFLGFLIFSFCILLWFAYALNGFKW
jgi:hypothetical protein